MEFKKIELEIDYKAAGLEDGEKPYLECYLPCNDWCKEMKFQRNNNTILILPGGGYGMTSAREHDPIAFQFLAAGYTVFALKYSVKPNVFPRAMYEAFAAIKMIRKYADEWLVDTNRIAVCGFSAGGHLTACTGAFWNEEFVKKALNVTEEHKPNALVLCYPVITATQYAHMGSFKNLLGKDVLTEDNAVPVMNSLLLGEQLAKNKIKFELHIYPKGAHGLALSNHITAKPDVTPPAKPQSWVKDAIDFLDNIAYND